MDAQTKQKVKEVMLNHLKSLGWQNVPNPETFAFNQAEPMFRILMSLNLVKYADWDAYYMAAVTQYEKAMLIKSMNFNF